MSASEMYDNLPDERPPQTVWAGIIATNPPDFGTKVSVVIPGIDNSLRWENCKWQSRDDVNLPHRGDPCLVAFDDNNEVWVVVWWPF